MRPSARRTSVVRRSGAYCAVTTEASPIYLLTYEYVDGILERRQPHRGAHLAHLERWSSDGPLAMAGATGDPPTGAVFVFETTDIAEVKAFAQADPYREAELITATRIEPWKLVAHRELSDPMT